MSNPIVVVVPEPSTPVLVAIESGPAGPQGPSGASDVSDLTATGMTAGNFLSVGPNDTVVETLPDDVRTAIGAAAAADPTLTGTMTVSGNAQLNSQVAFGGRIDATITADQNNWNPTGLASANAIYVDGGLTNRVITGLAGGAEGRILRIVNKGSTNTIALATNILASTDNNRFLFNNDVILQPGGSSVLSYDSAISKWRSFGTTIDKTGVAIGTYTNPTILVSSDGRILTAANGSLSAGLQYKNSSFTAVVGGRYALDSGSSLPTVSDPISATTGDSYEVYVVAGSGALIGMALASQSPIPIIRRYNGTSWATIPLSFQSGISVGSNSWSGSTFTGDQSFSGSNRPTSTASFPFLVSNSLITKGDADTLYTSQTAVDTRYSQKEVYISRISLDTGAQVTNSTTLVNTVLSLSLLPAGTYLIQCVVKAYSIGATTGGWRFQLTAIGGSLNSNILFAIGTGSAGMSNSIGNANTSITTAASAPHFVGTISDVLTITGTNTTLSIQHANETATATAGRGIRQGSYLRAIRLT